MVELCCCCVVAFVSVSALRAKMHTLVASNRFIVAHNPSTHASLSGRRRPHEYLVSSTLYLVFRNEQGWPFPDLLFMALTLAVYLIPLSYIYQR